MQAPSVHVVNRVDGVLMQYQAVTRPEAIKG